MPNLVSVVKGYAAHERDLFQRIAETRSRALATHAPTAAHLADEKALALGVARLLAVAEAYPQLMASQQFLQLQHELAITEDRIQAARRFYNANVREYRNQTRQFPGMLFAGLFGFGAIEFFEIEPVARAAPAVGLGA